MQAVRALLEPIFESDISVQLLLKTDVLRAHPEHGFPEEVISDPKWERVLQLDLNADFFDRMRVELGEYHLSCQLSFDTLYAVQIPYSAICMIVAMISIPAVPAPPAPAPSRPRSVLQLVPPLED
jgi:hypothetical protein